MSVQRVEDGDFWEQLVPSTAAVCSVVGDSCLQDRPPLLLSDSLSFIQPAAPLVLEALIGPELDCSRPYY